MKKLLIAALMCASIGANAGMHLGTSEEALESCKFLDERNADLSLEAIAYTVFSIKTANDPNSYLFTNAAESHMQASKDIAELYKHFECDKVFELYRGT